MLITALTCSKTRCHATEQKRNTTSDPLSVEKRLGPSEPEEGPSRLHTESHFPCPCGRDSPFQQQPPSLLQAGDARLKCSMEPSPAQQTHAMAFWCTYYKAYWCFSCITHVVQLLCIMKWVVKGCLGGLEWIMSISIISYGRKSRLTTYLSYITSPCERTKLIIQGLATVRITKLRITYL